MTECSSVGYAGRLLAEAEQQLTYGARSWMADAAVLGGLSTAAAIAWRGLAAHPAVQLAVTGWLAAEGVFYFVGKLRFRRLSRLPTGGPDTTRLAQHFERFLELRGIFCIREFLSGWFMGAPADEVLRGNVEDFVGYGFHCRLLHELSEPEQAAVRQFVNEVEVAWGVRFTPGHNPSLPFMAHCWEPLRAYHKPLLVFAITELLARIAHLLMFLMGFRPGRQGRFTYWHAPALAGSSTGAGTGVCGTDSAELLSPPLSPGPRRASIGLRRHSTSEAVVDAVHHAADAVHHVAEHALDATLTVTSTAAAAVAAQHPHGALAPLSPRAPSPAVPRSFSPSTGRAASLGGAAAGAGAAGSGGAAAGQGCTAAGGSKAPSPRRRQKGDSAIDYAASGQGGLTAMAADARAAEAAAAEADEEGGVEPFTEPAAVPAGAAGCAAHAMEEAAAQGQGKEDAGDAEARLLSPFRLAPLELPQQQQQQEGQGQGQGQQGHVGGRSSSPADSAGSGAAGAGPRAQGAAVPLAGSTRPDVPIVFLHGVGFGVLPYLHLVRDIQQACSNTPVIMVEVPHVALRLCWEAEEVDDVARAVVATLQRHGYRRACIVGHSYGTFVASRLCQLHPEMVHSACLLDPVTMLTCYPQLLYNFIYKSASAANFTSVGGAVDLLRFLCSRDLTIAQAFCRKFHWSELMLWPQDLPHRSLVVLSGQDDLVPSELVMAHIKLTGHPAKVMHHPDLGHGGILLCPPWQAELVANLRAMLAR